MSAILLTARFGTTVARWAQLPGGHLPELAFVGRSNAGKSTAINALCQRRRLAFASKTPGRTQALNFFELGRAGQPPSAFLVDTPGYGYAATPLAVRQDWDALAGRYLAEREALRGVVLVLDCRREVTDLDRSLLMFLRPDTPLMVLMAKADKLGASARELARRRILVTLNALERTEPLTLIVFSANTGLGLDTARMHIEGWLQTEPGDHAPTA
ncbi:MAG: putative GTP-binding protein EngB [Pseudomonadota bacterium]